MYYQRNYFLHYKPSIIDTFTLIDIISVLQAHATVIELLQSLLLLLLQINENLLTSEKLKLEQLNQYLNFSFMFKYVNERYV